MYLISQQLKVSDEGIKPETGCHTNFLGNKRISMKNFGYQMLYQKMSFDKDGKNF